MGDVRPDFLSGGHATLDGVGNSHAMIGVAGEGETPEIVDVRFDASNAIPVSQYELGNAPRIADDFAKIGCAAHAEDVRELFKNDSAELRIVTFQSLNLQGTAQESSQNNAAFRRSTRKLSTGERDCQDAALFDLRNDEAGPIQGMSDVSQPMARDNDRR